MISVQIQVVINDLEFKYEYDIPAAYLRGTGRVEDLETAEKYLLEGYHKINNALESQR